ncbi:hypothetical protein BamIOP4010DRAFT_4008 [Burkholderia ambifaria IOP40-10]|uniref:Uncharacterized protein n=1 Tax=Burkholderia ambifaria IOP40-10 TaxID=396596 RepID=B1FIZ8_9BURK|nr:hypothetical protein BamIOP4010DRAFT_4008 [Burkholderia ambifaria IOP40-10]
MLPAIEPVRGDDASIRSDTAPMVWSSKMASMPISTEKLLQIRETICMACSESPP